MTILIVSDLHANLEAVSALPKNYDQLWVLGDLVNYGPNPHEVIDFVRATATLVVRGNHDHAIGYDTDPRCSKPYEEMATEMARITQNLLSEHERYYLRTLPLSINTEVHGHRFYLCHAVPTDPLFAYCPPESPRWDAEVHAVGSGSLLVGHTHLQFEREIDGRKVINPGSVGQPKSAAPLAGYAVWQDGRFTLKTVPYNFEQTAAKIQRLEIPVSVREQLAGVLRNGVPPHTDQAGAGDQHTGSAA